MTHIRLYDILFATFAAFAILSSNVSADPGSVCESGGVNFVDGHTYTINTATSAPLLIVSQFAGCNNDTADVSITSPNGTIFPCHSVPLKPDDVDETSTCTINENQITPGNWIIILLSNNGDGKPFAAQRNITFVTGSAATSSASSGYSTVTKTVTSTVTAAVSSAPVTVTTTVGSGSTYTGSSGIPVCIPEPTTTTLIETQTCTVEVQNWVKVIEVAEPTGYAKSQKDDSMGKIGPPTTTVTTTITVPATGVSTATVTTTAAHSCATTAPRSTITECSTSKEYITVSKTYTTTIKSTASGYPTSSAW